MKSKEAHPQRLLFVKFSVPRQANRKHVLQSAKCIVKCAKTLAFFVSRIVTPSFSAVMFVRI